MSITSYFTKRLHGILFHSLPLCRYKTLAFFSEWGHVSFPSEYLTTRSRQNRTCVKAQLYNLLHRCPRERDLSSSPHV